MWYVSDSFVKNFLIIFLFIGLLACGGGEGTIEDNLASTPALNNTPIAKPVAETLNENQVHIFSLDGLDSDGDTLTYTIVTPPAFGNFAVDSLGTVTYTPNANYFGADSFTYIVSDGSESSSESTVSLTINQVDDPPTISAIANKETQKNQKIEFIQFSVDEGGGADEDGQSMSVVSITSGDQAKVADGDIIYSFSEAGDGNGGSGEIEITPVNNATGSVAITVSVSDGNSQTDLSFNLNIVEGLHPPVAYNVNASMAQNGSSPIVLSANDPVNSDPITSWEIVTQPSNGSLSGTAPNLTYTPNAGYSGQDMFTYRASDGEWSNLAAASMIVSGSAIFVVGDTGSLGNGDQQFKTRIEALGFTVTLIDDAASQASDADNVDLVIISASSGSGSVNTKFRDVATPVLTWERWLYDDMCFTASSGGADAGTVSTDSITITDPSHPYAGGYAAGALTVFNSNFNLVWGVPTADATIVAETAGAQPVLFVYDKDDSMYCAMTAPEKRVAFFFPDYGDGDLTADGFNLLDAAINEALAR